MECGNRLRVGVLVLKKLACRGVHVGYAAPIGAFFCPEIRAFMGFGARFLQPFPKSLVTVKYYSSTKVAVNSCY